MKILPFTVPIFILKFDQHEYYKNECLRLIEEQHSTTSKFGNQYNGESITKTDWYVGPEVKRQYFDLIVSDVISHLRNIFKLLDIEKFKISNVWFQQYHQNDFHCFHTHERTSWNCVYYLEFEKNNPGTTFKSFFGGAEFTPEISEGEILMFPSCLRHTSLPNKSSSRKTVVAFNIE